ncbi:MAG TPA: branched-chain amino acid ABC transporter permease [Ktedonobacteraceae bacterium]
MASRQTAERKAVKSLAESSGQRSVAGLVARLYAWRRWLASIVGLVIVGLLPTIYDQIFGFSAGFELHRISLIGIFIIAALAQNVLTGYAAQPSLGNAAFFGVSAYILTWLTSDLNQPYWLGILVAVLVSAILGVIIGSPALRISGAHLAVATLGLVMTVGALLNLWDTTAGRQDYSLTNLPNFLGDDHTLYYFVFVVVVVLLFLTYHLLRSRVGRAWVAIRDNETAAEAFGINLTTYKLQAFVISAAMTGLAGALYATWATTAASSMSSADQTIAFLAMIVVGGLGSLAGSILGAIFVGFLPLLLGQLPSPLSIGSLQLQVSTLTTGIYGLLLLLALIFFPTGLSSLGARGKSLLQRVNKRGGTQ